jgi:hypothetical protein
VGTAVAVGGGGRAIRHTGFIVARDLTVLPISRRTNVSKIKNISRLGWVIVGLVAAMLLVPTMAVAATVAYNGIEGTNGTTTTQNKALVTSAGQLLTTGVEPTKYVEYLGYGDTADGNSGGFQCETASTIPSGKAFVAQQINVTVFEVDSPIAYSNPSGVYGGSYFIVRSDSSGNAGSCEGPSMADGEAPGGTVGNVAIPLVPGYVVPSGYAIDVYTQGLSADIWINGYLVPSADAPPTPNVTKMATNNPRDLFGPPRH